MAKEKAKAQDKDTEGKAAKGIGLAERAPMLARIQREIQEARAHFPDAFRAFTDGGALSDDDRAVCEVFGRDAGTLAAKLSRRMLLASK